MPDYDELPYLVVERRSGGFGAFVIGALAGAAVALLLAPRSGRETREELQNGARRLRDAAEETARQVRDSVTQTLDEVRDEVGGRFDAAREAVDAGRQAARESRAAMETRLHPAGDGGVEPHYPPIDDVGAAAADEEPFQG
jgi:gas vesicle protein